MATNSKQYTTKVAATASLAGKEIPLSSFAVSYGLNSLPTAQFRPALGDKTFNSRLKFDLQASYSGKPATLHITYGGKTYLVFSGLVSGVSAARVEQDHRSAGLVAFNCVHEAAAMAGLPAMDRFTLVAGGSVPQTYDFYKTFGPTQLSRIWSPDAGLGDITKLPDDIAKFLLRVLNALYQSEKAASAVGGGQYLRDVDQPAAAALAKVQTPFDMSFPQGSEDINANLKASLVDHMTNAWMGQNGLTLLTQSMASYYGAMSPTCDRVALIPDFAVYATPAATIPYSSIFGVQRSVGVDPVKVGGVVIPVNTQSADKANQIAESNLVWAPDNPVGQLIYMEPPAWARMLSAGLVMQNSPPPSVRTRDYMSGPSGEIMHAVEKSANFPNVIKWYKAIAAAEFGSRVWSRDQITLSVKFTPDLWLGEPVLADIRDSKISFESKLIGVVAGVSLGVAHGSFDMSVTIANTRSQADNDRFAMTQHPLYQSADPAGAGLQLFSQG